MTVTATLKIYTMTHCPNCEDTRATAAVIARLVPEIKVELINLDDPSAEKPSQVFSVPTYIMNGLVLALGNPYVEHLERSIRTQIGG